MTTKDSNQLFPVFLKMENREVLLIGGGNVALEKLNALVQNSPAVCIKVVAIHISDQVRELAQYHKNIELLERAFKDSDLDDAYFVIAAVNDLPTSIQIRDCAAKKGKLINVADKPALCDFYLGSIVKKGNLKIAISTNGKSPTVAKRLKEVLNDLLPEEIDEVLDNLQNIRNQLKGDFNNKVRALNELTKVLVSQENLENK